MALRKKKMTKRVWYDQDLWKVEQIISPNEYDDFLVLSRQSDDSIHEDGKTVPVEMVLIDAHNDTFYPNTKRVRELMKKRNKVAEKYRDLQRKQDRELSSIWCETSVDILPKTRSTNPHIGSEFCLDDLFNEDDDL